MTKPIIDHRGAYVGIVPDGYTFWYICNGDIMNCEALGWEEDNMLDNHVYVTREAAEMALIRAKALQRLKAMAYGEKPAHEIRNYISMECIFITANDGFDISLNFYDYCIPHEYILPVYFYGYENAEIALKTLTPEEKEAFLYVYNPEEGS